MEIAALVIAALSAAFTAWGLWYSHGLKTASERSATAAENSAEAARKTATIDQERRADELADAERNRVVWSLEHVNKSRYQLRNIGTDTAYGVQIETNATRTDGNTSVDEFPAGHAESYMILRAWGDGSDRMTVTWHYQPDLSDEPQHRELLL